MSKKAPAPTPPAAARVPAAPHPAAPDAPGEPPPTEPARPPVKARAAAPTPVSASLRVMGCELQSAPAHELVVRLSGESADLQALRRSILRSLARDDGEPGLLPGDLRRVLDELPR